MFKQALLVLFVSAAAVGCGESPVQPAGDAMSHDSQTATELDPGAGSRIYEARLDGVVLATFAQFGPARDFQTGHPDPSVELWVRTSWQNAPPVVRSVVATNDVILDSLDDDYTRTLQDIIEQYCAQVPPEQCELFKKFVRRIAWTRDLDTVLRMGWTVDAMMAGDMPATASGPPAHDPRDGVRTLGWLTDLLENIWNAANADDNRFNDDDGDGIANGADDDFRGTLWESEDAKAWVDSNGNKHLDIKCAPTDEEMGFPSGI